jgi:hypothetical protein
MIRCLLSLLLLQTSLCRLTLALVCSTRSFPRLNPGGSIVTNNQGEIFRSRTRLYSGNPPNEADESDSNEQKQANMHERPQLRPFKNVDASAVTPNNDDSLSFSTGKNLQSLRADLDNLRENLQWAEAIKDHELVGDLRLAIANGERLDPDLVYAKALKNIAETKASKQVSDLKKLEIIETWERTAQSARSVLAQFQLDGLWIGK